MLFSSCIVELNSPILPYAREHSGLFDMNVGLGAEMIRIRGHFELTEHSERLLGTEIRSRHD